MVGKLQLNNQRILPVQVCGPGNFGQSSSIPASLAPSLMKPSAGISKSLEFPPHFQTKQEIGDILFPLLKLRFPELPKSVVVILTMELVEYDIDDLRRMLTDSTYLAAKVRKLFLVTF
jgi:hypothetical protein